MYCITVNCKYKLLINLFRFNFLSCPLLMWICITGRGVGICYCIVYLYCNVESLYNTKYCSVLITVLYYCTASTVTLQYYRIVAYWPLYCIIVLQCTVTLQYYRIVVYRPLWTPVTDPKCLCIWYPMHYVTTNVKIEKLYLTNKKQKFNLKEVNTNKNVWNCIKTKTLIFPI